jgi:hypothetical protein
MSNPRTATATAISAHIKGRAAPSPRVSLSLNDVASEEVSGVSGGLGDEKITPNEPPGADGGIDCANGGIDGADGGIEASGRSCMQTCNFKIFRGASALIENLNLDL